MNNYIKMCTKADSIQRDWIPKFGDLVRLNFDCRTIIINDKYPPIRYYKNESIFLPSREGLQKLSGLTWWKFDEECNIIRRRLLEDPLSEIEVGKEGAGICVVMERKYSKFWNGKDWAKGRRDKL